MRARKDEAMAKPVNVTKEHPEDRRIRLDGEKYGAQHAAEFFATLADPHDLIGIYDDESAHRMLNELRERFWGLGWVPKAK
jgi:hypothetical protein